MLGEDIPVTQGGPTFNLATSNLLVGPAAGTNTVVLAVLPQLPCGAGARQTRRGCICPLPVGPAARMFFTYDTNPGATRTGTLTIAGQTLTVNPSRLHLRPRSGPGNCADHQRTEPPIRSGAGSAGNVYIADTFNSALKKWSIATDTVTLVDTNGLALPVGLALDSAGDIFTGDADNHAVEEWSAATSSLSTVVSVGSGTPAGVALDAMTNVYIADFTDSSIEKWTAATSNLSTLISGQLVNPYGVTLDAADNVYIGDLQ